VEGVWYSWIHVTVTDLAGNCSLAKTVFKPWDPTEASSALPLRLALRPVTPNPAVGNARVAFDLPRDAQVRIRVFDVAGRTVATLVDGARRGGSHAVTWNGRRSNGEMAGSGIYFVKMEVGGQAQIQKMVVAR
jgi:serine protease